MDKMEGTLEGTCHSQLASRQAGLEESELNPNCDLRVLGSKNIWKPNCEQAEEMNFVLPVAPCDLQFQIIEIAVFF